jgi:hypothetical protein
MFWVIGIGIGVVAFLLSRQASAGMTQIGLTTEDVEYLARMMAIEHPNGSDDELVGIAWVGINRLRSGRFGSTMRDVVTAVNFAGGGANGDRYRRIIVSPSGYVEDGRRSPVDHPQYDRIIDLCFQVAQGEAPTPIGDRLHFIHPRNMENCSREGERDGGRVCYSGKWVPSWAAVEPLWIGETLFS